MEHLGDITRRQLLGLGAVAAGSLLIPSMAYAASPELTKTVQSPSTTQLKP